MTSPRFDAPSALGDHDLRIALYQPDQPGNVGAIIRTAACLGAHVEIIEPCGFAMSDRALRRAGMDYLAGAWSRHDDWRAFEAWAREEGRRIVLATTRAATFVGSHDWRANDILLLGRESAGVPDEVHERADARVVLPMRANARSLNVAASAAAILALGLDRIGACGE